MLYKIWLLYLNIQAARHASPVLESITIGICTNVGLVLLTLELKTTSIHALQTMMVQLFMTLK